MFMVPVTTLLLLVVSAVDGSSLGGCDFADLDCGWTWSEGWKLLTAHNLTVLGLGTTAPAADAQNNVRGNFLYWTADRTRRRDRLEISSPIFEAHTLPSCSLQMSLHMYQMDPARFQIVIEAPNSTWESTRFAGNSAHTWETQVEKIGFLSQPFRIILEIINEVPVFPSHVAIDDIQIVDCYDKRPITTDCRLRQFQCDNLLCIEGSEVCDVYPHCSDGEDELQDCDKIPESAYCNFEAGMCEWYSNGTDNSSWVLHKGQSLNARTGPTVDHTFRNKTGTYLLAKFPSGRAFGVRATFTSPWFAAPPYYHRNVHSAYYNSCQIRFYFHKFGPSVGELRVLSLESDPSSKQPKVTELWRSFGNKGDFWWNAVVPLPNMTNMYQLQFIASRGTGHSDISIDDFSLSPECFGIGVPENESIVPTSDTIVSNEKPVYEIKKYVFSTCGARGRFGPNETLCTSSYHNTSTKINLMNEPTLEGVQRWIVPQSGLYTVFVKGAGGGDGVMLRNGDHSMGTSIRATFDWEEGDEIFLLIGQKGSSPCGDQPYCVTGISSTGRRSDALRILKQINNNDVGGGGGGATYLFTIDPITHNRHPMAIAGGGGGLSARLPHNDSMPNVSPHGLAPNSSMLPLNGYTGSGAGGGGGWDDDTTVSTGGLSLREGSRGGKPCKEQFENNGGFGGGGGGCLSGGGGGGYRDPSEIQIVLKLSQRNV